VHAFGDAVFHGDLSNAALAAPVVGIVLDRSTNGYWLVAKNGTVSPFGKARSFGNGTSTGITVGMTPSSDDGGYVLVRSHGGVSALGDAKSGGTVPTAKPIVGISHP
jgi:hypothetical protein